MEIKNFRAIHDKELIYELIEEGEHVCQDFKFSISDSRKIARSIAAFANNQGGRLLVGVKDNGNIAGIRSEEEFYMIEQAAEMYCKPAQKVKQTLYCIDGKYVLLVSIAKSFTPVMAQDDNRRWLPYYRIADENIQVPELMLKVWKASKKRHSVFSFSDLETKMLSYISRVEYVTVEGIAKEMHMSLSSTEDAVVSLCSMGVLQFVYHEGEWRISAAEQ